MSYSQAIKWAKKHPKGTKQPMLFTTGSSWPASICLICDKHFLNGCIHYQEYLKEKLTEGRERNE